MQHNNERKDAADNIMLYPHTTFNIKIWSNAWIAEMQKCMKEKQKGEKQARGRENSLV